MSEALQPGRWHLLRLKELHKKEDRKPRVEVVFDTPSGAALRDDFYLTEKAISRFECLAHRSGCEAEIKTPAQVDAKALAAMLGRRVWAFVIESEGFGGTALRTDGWKFRPENDPPEEELFVDYGKQDEWARAMEGL